MMTNDGFERLFPPDWAVIQAFDEHFPTLIGENPERKVNAGRTHNKINPLAWTIFKQKESVS